MNPPMVYPDAERIVIDYLDPYFTAQVRADIPNPRPATFLRVRRVGGPARVVSDASLLTVEAWAASPAAAYLLISDARARLEAMAFTVQDGVVVYSVAEVGGPVNLPDPTSTQARYTITVEVVLRGEPLSA